MIKAIKKGMVSTKSINDANYVMYRYSVTLVRMKEVLEFLEEKGKYFVTSV
jgi:hypothetical protein